MQRTVVYKLKPTAAQAQGLERYLAVTRDLYNAALEQRIGAYRATGRGRSWVAQSRELRELREAGLLEGCHVHAAQLALRRLERAYDGFFERCRTDARRKGFPRFKGGRHWRSFGLKEHGNGWRLDAENGRLKLSGVGAVRLRSHRELSGKPKTLAVVRKADGWYAHVACDVPATPTVPDSSPALRGALDLGVEALATLHTGERVDARALTDQFGAPVFADRAAHARRKLKHEQRVLARCKRGSTRRVKQRERVALAHLKVARVRRDFLHKQSRRLAEQYRFVAVEDLTVTAMTRSAKGTVEQPGRNVRQKAGLNRGILDAAWTEFLRLLDYKLADQGGGLVNVDPHGTSRECSGCGQRVPKALSERQHECPHCGLSLHRDHNAALNIHHRAWAVPVAEAA